MSILQKKEEQELIKMAMKMSEKSFEQVWDNDEDSVYDELQVYEKE